jgi:CcmD family protein
MTTFAAAYLTVWLATSFYVLRLARQQCRLARSLNRKDTKRCF